MASPEPIDDPLLKELLTAFKEDSQRLAQDILQGVWMQAAIALVALFLALSSTVRIIAFVILETVEQRPFARSPPVVFGLDAALTIVLFVLSILSLRSYLILRGRYSRLSALAEKLGR